MTSCLPPLAADLILYMNWLRPEHRRLKNVLHDVIHWQRRHGIAPDGLLGPHTWSYRDARLASLARRCHREMRAAGLMHLQTYRWLDRLF